jgi:GNAT superfamily N-acetyltransferase
MSEALRLAPAREADLPLVLAFIRKLAEYEKLSHSVTATEDSLRRSLFGERPAAEAILAYWNDQPAGFAVFFHNFSTFLGRPGLYLEDLYVDPEYRGRGIGKALLLHLVRLARERGCGRMEWAVLDWNRPAIEFYKKLGAVALDEWTTYRLTSGALELLAPTNTTS